MSTSPRTPIRVLLVCYHFPPMPTTGARRLARFVRYLPPDFEIDVLTVKDPPEGLDGAEVAFDRPLRVHRVPTLPTISQEVLQRQLGADSLLWKGVNTALTFGLWIPDRQVAWLPSAARVGRRLLRERAYDVILSSSPPHSAHLLAVHLKRRCDARLVLDYRDPWTHNPTRRWPTPLHRRAERWLERRVLREADLVIANTRGNKDKVLASFPFVDDDRVMVLPNGFDPEQRGPLPRPAHTPRQRRAILFTGHLYDENTALVPALRRLQSDWPDVASRVVFRFVGTRDPRVDRELQELSADGLVELQPRRRDDELDADFAAADGLLYLVPEAGESWIPSKVYDYLAVSRPILGLLPEGDASRLLAASGVATCTGFAGDGEVARVFRDFIVELCSGRERRVAKVVLDQVDGKRQVERLAAALGALVGPEPTLAAEAGAPA